MRYFILLLITLFLLSCSHYIKLFKTKIEGKKMSLSSITNYTKSSDSNITITINSNSFTGFAGCNDYNGTFSMNKDYTYFKLDSVGTKVCLNLDDETEYLHKLVKTKMLLIQGKKIYFKDIDESTILTFTK